MILRLFPSVVVLILASGAFGLAHAQDRPKEKATDSSGRSKWLAKADAPNAIPDEVALNILIRRTLMTVNDANLSGNYTVLRDLAAPSFQSANDQAKLSGIFAKLRDAKIDMAPIVYFDPRLVRQPQITKGGMLRLAGFMPTKPQQVNFDMLFQHVSDRWRLFGIAVNLTPVKSAAATPEAGGGSAAKGGEPSSKAKQKKK
jgi:hypothetical protein